MSNPTHEPVLPTPGYSPARGLDVNIRPMSPSYLHQDILQLKVSMSTANHDPVVTFTRIFPAEFSMSHPTMRPVLPSPDFPAEGYSPAEGLDVNIRPMSPSSSAKDILRLEDMLQLKVSGQIQPMSPSYLHQDILQLKEYSPAKVSMSTPTHEPFLLHQDILHAEGLHVNIRPMTPVVTFTRDIPPAEDILQLKMSPVNSQPIEPVLPSPGYSSAEVSMSTSDPEARYSPARGLDVNIRPMSRLTFTQDILQLKVIDVNIQPMSPSYLHQDILQLKVSMSTSDP
eukprot:gene13762-19666_t